MPEQSNKVERLRDEAEQGEIPYISKSRIKKFVTCPRKFYYSYIQGVPTAETEAMRRGTDIHETIEDYYENAISYVRREGEPPEQLESLLPSETHKWARYLDPYITNFIKWEYERLDSARKYVEEEVGYPNLGAKGGFVAEEWLPVAVEGEAWLDDPLDYGEDEAIPWMGYADVIVKASSLPACEQDTGVVIVDFKTSDETPQEKYRDDGIYLEGEYYAMLFESEYDVASVAGFYPAPGELVVSPLKESRRNRIREVVEHIQEFRDRENYETDEQPLCQYGVAEGCDFYGVCSSSWGEPVKNTENYEEFKRIMENGSVKDVVDRFGCTFNAASYWKYKYENNQLEA